MRYITMIELMLKVISVELAGAVGFVIGWLIFEKDKPRKERS